MKGLVLTYYDLNTNISCGVLIHYLYITPTGIILNYTEYNSQQSGCLTMHKLALEVGLIYVTPSGISLFSNDPRTFFIFNYYKIGKNSIRTNFAKALRACPHVA